MNAPTVIFILIELSWLYCLIAHLKSKDLDPTDKICWTVVLTVLNALGLLLFILFGPQPIEEEAEDYEDNINKSANEGRL